MSEEIIKTIFSNNLQYYMNAAGVNQSDIMRDLKIPSATISSWVNGKRLPRMGKIQELADYLNITKSDLIENVVIGSFKSKKEANDFKKTVENNPNSIFSDKRSIYNLNKLNDNFMLAIQKFQNKEDLTYEEEDAITEYVESEQFSQEKEDIKQIAQKAYDYISFLHSHSYASSAEEYDKLQDAKRIDFEQKRSSSIHKYDAVVEITPEAIERLKEDAEAREILKKYESGEKILESEYKKVNEYHNRMMERSKLLQDWLEWYKNTCEPLNNEGRKKVAEYAEALAETDKFTKPDEWFKGRPTKEEIDKEVKTYLNDDSTDEPPQK